MDENIDPDRDYRNMWILKTDNPIKNLTWWWWWWIFFIRQGDEERTKQLMILWSTKYTDYVKVMDHDWTCRTPPVWDGNTLKFNGMTASWWYDGEKMEDPQVLVESDFEVYHDGLKGELKPLLDGRDYRFYGSPEEYHVNIIDDRNDFHFKMTPWNRYLSEQRFNENQYTKKYSYNIMKIFGMKLKGRIAGEDVEGSAYFQRVTVNAPAAPWYWGVVHCEDGSYIDYFQPFIGPQIFRTTEKPTSLLDWGDIRLNRSIHFYNASEDREYRFRTKETKIRHKVKDGLPIFDITGRNKEGEFHLRWRAYSRAYWRFQQRRSYGMKSILYYNEYPAEVMEFSFRTADGGVTLKKGDLGWMTGNMEHSWGKLI